MKNSKAIGLTLLLVVYVLAGLLGVGFFFVFESTGMALLLNLFLCDVIATVFVWLCGIILGTASVYDPYWSVQTIVIYVLLLFHYQSWNLGTALFLVPLLFYSVRLTMNFALGFDSLSYVDWRYKMLREKSGKAFQIVNLLGICLFPTCIVYAASVPMFLFATDGVWNPLMIPGLVLMVGAVILELVSDMQMRKFRKNRTDKSQIINVGLWKYSRHPNYLGEISFWFAIYIAFVPCFPNLWFWGAGALANLLLFLFISIPMEEKHMLAYKPNLQEYIDTTSMLLILPRRKKKD